MKEKFDEESKKALVSYRLERAYGTLKEADVMRREGGSTMPPSTACIMRVIMRR